MLYVILVRKKNILFFFQNIHHLGLPSVLARRRDAALWPYPSGMYVLFNGL